MTTRRALTPAARGVSLAVLAALRGGRVDLADQADGSTLATSTAPDGTVLLHATLWMPVRGVDTRTPTLPNVSMIPAAAEVPPAPVAMPAGEAAALTTVRLWLWRADLERLDEDTRAWLLEPVEGVCVEWERQPGGWTSVALPAGSRETRTIRSLCQCAQIALHEGDAAPPAPAQSEPAQSEPARIRGLASGDLIEMDGARATVGGVDHEGFAWCETNAKGYLTGPVERALWSEVEHLGGNRWRVRPVETETPSQKAKREAKAAKPKRAAKAPKARPARLTPEPEADALTRHGQRCVVAQLHEGGPWELVWCDEMPGQMTHDVAWRSVEEQAHRARRYDRGGHCAADTRDTPRAGGV